MEASKSKKAPPAAKEAAPAPQEAKRRPIQSFREDDVTVSIWAREFKGRIFHSCSFERSYKDPTGQWRYTRYFGQDDLGKVMSLEGSGPGQSRHLFTGVGSTPDPADKITGRQHADAAALFVQHGSGADLGLGREIAEGAHPWPEPAPMAAPTPVQATPTPYVPSGRDATRRTAPCTATPRAAACQRGTGVRWTTAHSCAPTATRTSAAERDHQRCSR